MLADQSALDPPTRTPDPRLAHAFPSVWERHFVAGLRSAVTVPVLAVESPASPTAPAERAERVAMFGGGARFVTCDEATGQAVAAALENGRWLQA